MSTVDSDLGAQLEALRLKVSPETACEVNGVLESLTDIISTKINTAITDNIADSEEEAKMWMCFAETYQQELNERKKLKGKAPSMSAKQQIFADILVWAEVSRPGYDPLTAAFVTGPHIKDESFQRIGRALQAAKLKKGVTRL